MKKKIAIGVAFILLGSATLCLALTGRWYYTPVNGISESDVAEVPLSAEQVPSIVDGKPSDVTSNYIRQEKFLVRYKRGRWPFVNVTQTLIGSHVFCEPVTKDK